MELTIESRAHGTQTVLLDDADWHKVKEYKWRVNKNYKSGRMYAMTGKGPELMGRLIMDVPKELNVCYKNGNTLDNRRENLIVCTKKQVQEYCHGVTGRSKSGIRGVYGDKRSGEWVVKVNNNNKSVFLGYFKNIEEAEKVAIEARKRFYTHSRENM